VIAATYAKTATAVIYAKVAIAVIAGIAVIAIAAVVTAEVVVEYYLPPAEKSIHSSSL